MRVLKSRLMDSSSKILESEYFEWFLLFFLIIISYLTLKIVENDISYHIKRLFDNMSVDLSVMIGAIVYVGFFYSLGDHYIKLVTIKEEKIQKIAINSILTHVKTYNDPHKNQTQGKFLSEIKTSLEKVDNVTFLKGYFDTFISYSILLVLFAIGYSFMPYLPKSEILEIVIIMLIMLTITLGLLIIIVFLIIRSESNKILNSVEL